MRTKPPRPYSRMIAEDFKLNIGDIESTGHTIASRVEDNQTLFDITRTLWMQHSKPPAKCLCSMMMLES